VHLGVIFVNNQLDVQLRSKDSQVKTQLVLWIFILFKLTRWPG